MATICEIDAELMVKIMKFKKRKEQNTAAIIMKIDSKKHLIVEDEEFEDTTIEEVRDELPSHLPRFVLYSHVLNHGDGRISYPYCLIFVSPEGCKTELQMMYAGSKLQLVREAQATKVLEVRSVEELTEDWLNKKLSLFG